MDLEEIAHHCLDIVRVGHMILSLQHSQWWSYEKIRTYQRHALVEIMRHAVIQVPYYAALNISPDSLNDVTDLQRFPLLTKRLIQDHEGDLIDRTVKRKELQVSRTSGSSSEPTDTYFDRYSWLLCKYALKVRRTLLAGFPLGKRVLILSEQVGVENNRASGAFSLSGLLYSQRNISIFEPLQKQFDVLSQFSPDIIYGAPSALAEIASFAAAEGLLPPRILTIFTSSELLSTGTRRQIEMAFRGQVLDVYGSTEFKEIAFQCHHGRYHTNFESVYLETLPDDTEPDGPPALVITSLVNRAMPLLRFRIDDYARIAQGSCPCGRQSPYLQDIAGRESEYLTLTGGRRISPYLLTTAIETCPAVRKYQIVHRGPNQVEVQLMFREQSVGKTQLYQLHDALKDVLGEGIQVVLQAVDHIQKTQAGKHQIVRKTSY